MEVFPIGNIMHMNNVCSYKINYLQNMDTIAPRTFYGKNVMQQYILREIPSGSEDSELEDDDDVEPSTSLVVDNQHLSDDDSDNSDDNVPLAVLQRKIATENNIGKKKISLNWKNQGLNELSILLKEIRRCQKTY